jgi:hypothetical protein
MITHNESALTSVLFEDDRAEPWSLPHLDRQRNSIDFDQTSVTFELDNGSLMTGGSYSELRNKAKAILYQVGKICRSEWYWDSYGRTITTPTEIVHDSLNDPEDKITKIVEMPTDHRQYILLNFASRDDAMLVRMTIQDLKVVRNDNSGDVS